MWRKDGDGDGDGDGDDDDFFIWCEAYSGRGCGVGAIVSLQFRIPDSKNHITNGYFALPTSPIALPPTPIAPQMVYPYMWTEGSWLYRQASLVVYIVQNFWAKVCTAHGSHSNSGKTIIMAYFGLIIVMGLVLAYLHLIESDFLERIGLETKQKKYNDERRFMEERFHDSLQITDAWKTSKERGFMGHYTKLYREAQGKKEDEARKARGSEGSPPLWLRAARALFKTGEGSDEAGAAKLSTLRRMAQPGARDGADRRAAAAPQSEEDRPMLSRGRGEG